MAAVDSGVTRLLAMLNEQRGPHDGMVISAPSPWVSFISSQWTDSKSNNPLTTSRSSPGSSKNSWQCGWK